MSLLENIKRLCREKHITIADLEKGAGLSENAIFRWNKVTPGIDKVKKVADTLEVTVDEPVSGEDILKR